MIGARAARILEGISTFASSASAAARVATLTPEKRQARWRCVVLKLLWIFRALGMKTATTAAIGVNAYRAIVEGVRSVEKLAPEVFRIFQGEGVGKPLAPAAEGGPVRPELCRHLELVRRGNKTSKWWTCKGCGNRYERMKIHDEECSVLTTTILKPAATSETPLTRSLARELLERDRLSKKP
jgi:hypothetical protein